MALRILKFGGSSVATIERIMHSAQLAVEQAAEGHRIVVVVSAMQGETDRLIELFNAFSAASVREYAALVATGEQVSSSLFSLALTQKGHLAHSYTGAQLPITTTGDYQKARIVDVGVEALQRDLQVGVIPVVAGFQGVNCEGEITTFGRGGSDLTAVALSAALDADECLIYTDVDGVYTSDPRVVPKAHRLDEVTFDEMMELSGLGAKVLQNRSLELAAKKKVPLRVLSSFHKVSKGTKVVFDADQGAEYPLISGVVFDAHQAQLTLKNVPNRPGLASYILSAIGQADIEVDMIMQSDSSAGAGIDFSYTVQRDDYNRAFSLSETLIKELAGGQLVASDRLAKLSLVGVGMRSHAGIASKMFSALGQEGIEVHFLTAAEVKISAIIDQKYLELGARTLHAAFGLDQ